MTLVLGGARSGKSVAAEAMALAHTGTALYFATGPDGDTGDTDHDMAERIARHRERRGDRFSTVEAGAELVAALTARPDGPALVDSLGTWVAASWSEEHDAFLADADALVHALRARRGPSVVVSDEVGLSVHPETPAGRRFRDDLGSVNQAVAAIAEDVWLVVAGRGLRLDRLPEP